MHILLMKLSNTTIPAVLACCLCNNLLFTTIHNSAVNISGTMTRISRIRDVAPDLTCTNVVNKYVFICFTAGQLNDGG